MALLIVDMQAEFSTSKLCLDPVLDAVREAKEKKEPIVALEYESMGPTVLEITSILQDYGSFARATKCEDGGGDEALKAFKDLAKDFSEIKVVGVNSCFCVHDTIVDIMEAERDLKVSFNHSEIACTCPSYKSRGRPHQKDCATRLEDRIADYIECRDIPF